jgi:triacylglycerol lipase
MRRVFKYLAALFINAYYWGLDYFYIGFWQFFGLLRHGDARVFLSPIHSAPKAPVIVIPGVYERWEFMKPVAQAIFKAGYTVHVVEGLGYNRGSVEDMARLVRHYVEGQHLSGCVIIGHSKGGLIGKYLLLQAEDTSLFKGMIAINAPFQGSKYAYILPGRFLRVFIPSSPLLALLAQNERVNEKIISIYSIFDPHIPGGSFLKGAKNLQLNIRGHFRIIKSKPLHSEIIACLKKFQD